MDIATFFHVLREVKCCYGARSGCGAGDEVQGPDVRLTGRTGTLCGPCRFSPLLVICPAAEISAGYIKKTNRERTRMDFPAPEDLFTV